MLKVSINISLVSGGDGSRRWVRGGGWEWLAGRGGGGAGGVNVHIFILTHTGDLVVRLH
jgi:hypothetical protein